MTQPANVWLVCEKATKGRLHYFLVHRRYDGACTLHKIDAKAARVLIDEKVLRVEHAGEHV